MCFIGRAREGPKSAARALVARLRGGDEGAFQVVVTSYAGRMLAATRRILRSAEDAVQDAFLSAFAAFERFRRVRR